MSTQHIVRIYPPDIYENVRWAATTDHHAPGDPVGIGSTEMAAIINLYEKLRQILTPSP